jgi:choline-glycine betaine transporter
MIVWTPVLSLAGAIFGAGVFSIGGLALLGGLELGSDGQPPTLRRIVSWIAILAGVSLLASMLIYGIIDVLILYRQMRTDPGSL